MGDAVQRFLKRRVVRNAFSAFIFQISQDLESTALADIAFEKVRINTDQPTYFGIGIIHKIRRRNYGEEYIMEHRKRVERIVFVYVHGAGVDRPRASRIRWGFERPEELRIDVGSTARVTKRGSAQTINAVPRDCVDEQVDTSSARNVIVVITVEEYSTGHYYSICPQKVSVPSELEAYCGRPDHPSPTCTGLDHALLVPRIRRTLALAENLS